MSLGNARTWARSLDALISEAEKVAEQMQAKGKDNSETHVAHGVNRPGATRHSFASFATFFLLFWGFSKQPPTQKDLL